MASYLNNENVYELQYNLLTTFGSRDPILGKIGQRSALHGHIMYTAKMCQNSVVGDRILFLNGN